MTLLNSFKQKSAKTFDDPLWVNLIKKLSNIYSSSIHLVFPDKCDEKYFSMFHEIEEENFRFELRYTSDELERLFKKPGLLFFFIIAKSKPEIVVLGYSLETQKKTFYLDTFAVRQSGKGIGQIVLKFLIELLLKKGYREIILDTEEEDEKGIPLRQFYEKNGFRVIACTEKGNLTMKLSLDAENFNDGLSR